MAKIVKVKIKVVLTSTPRGIYVRRTYPPEYFIPNHRKRIEQLAREADVRSADIIARGDSTDHALCVVPDEALAAMTASPDIVEITEEEANNLGSIWNPQVTDIFDLQKIIDILDKARNSQELTQAEKDAIDPDNAAIGVNRTNVFIDRMTDAITKVG